MFSVFVACSNTVPAPSGAPSEVSSEGPGAGSAEAPAQNAPPQGQATGDQAASDPPAPVAEAPPPEPPPPPPPPFVPEKLPKKYLHFTDSCKPGKTVTIAAVGDLLVHRELQKQALEADDGFINLWSGVVDLLDKADFTYANLEGPTAWGLNRKGKAVPDPGKKFDNVVYTGYTRFNYHASIIEDLKKSGVDIVSMSNNHALDRFSLGLDRTLDALDAAKLTHFGARRKGSDDPFHVVTEVNGINIAWVGCTLYTNLEDKDDQVSQCFKKPRRILPTIRKLSKDKSIDAIIAVPHVGLEYLPQPKERKVKFVYSLMEAGALVALGSHPHVMQPWKKHVTRDGRETFLIHSLGNFCSHQQALPRRSSMILYVGLTKGEDGVTRVNGVRYVPLHNRMEGDKEKYFTEAIDRVGGPANSRRLTVRMFEKRNLIGPDDPLVTNPHCSPDWEHHVK